MAGYSVKYGSSSVYVPGSDSYAIHNAKLGMKTAHVSTFAFTMPPGHPLRSTIALQDLSHPVRVWFDDELLFCGYVTHMTVMLSMELAVECVSDLNLIASVHARIEDHPQTNGKRRVYTAPQLFEKLVTYYNGLVTSSRRFAIGHTVGASAVGYYDSEAGKTVVDASASTPTGILDILGKSILEPYNCMLKVWYEDGTRYIGLYTSAPDTSGQVIRFGENMTKLALDTHTDDLYTGCHPTGGSYRIYDLSNAKRIQTTRNISAGSYILYVKSMTGSDITVESGDIFLLLEGEYAYDSTDNIGTTETIVAMPVESMIGQNIPAGTNGYVVKKGTDSTSATVTLERMADGTYQSGYRKSGELVYNVDAVARYGLKTFTFADSDIRYTEDLLSKAIAELSQRLLPSVTIDTDGVDMALYRSGYTHLVAGQKVRVVSEPHGIDMTMQVVEASLDLDNPGATKYTIGVLPKTASRGIKAASDNANDVRDMLVYDINDVITGAQIARLS